MSSNVHGIVGPPRSGKSWATAATVSLDDLAWLTDAVIGRDPATGKWSSERSQRAPG